MKLHGLHCVFLVLVLAQKGDAISCLTCSDTTTDNPSFPMPSGPDSCSATGGVPTECPSYVTSCLTSVVDIYYSIAAVGDVTMTQTQRDCSYSSYDPPADRCLTGEEFQPILDATQQALDQMFSGGGLGSMMTFQGIEGRACICVTDDCTPPMPSSTSGGVDPLGGSPVEEVSLGGSPVEMVPLGGALSCLTCQDTSTDNPNFPLPAGPDSCSVTGGVSTPCDPGITSCMTMVLHMDSTIQYVGDVVITQTQRGCSVMPTTPPSDRCLSEEEFQPLLTSTADELERTFVDMGMGSMITFRGIDGSMCLCDTVDCTPPNPLALPSYPTSSYPLPTSSYTDAGSHSTCPVTGYWFVDWDASFQCLMVEPQQFPFETPGQILASLTIPDIIQAAGAAWTADTIVESEAEICMRILPQLSLLVGGPYMFQAMCDPLLTSLREGTPLDAEAHCRLILNLTAVISSVVPFTTPPSPTTQHPNAIPFYEPGPFGIYALRPFDYEGELEQIQLQFFGPDADSTFGSDRVCTRLAEIVNSGASLQDIILNVLNQVVEDLSPRAVEICQSWDEIENALPSELHQLFLYEVPDLVAHLLGFTDRGELCAQLTLNYQMHPNDFHNTIPSGILANSFIVDLSDEARCMEVAEDVLDILFVAIPDLTPEAINAQIYQITGMYGISDICQLVSESFADPDDEEDGELESCWNFCENGGICVTPDNSRVCLCPAEFTGTMCETSLQDSTTLQVRLVGGSSSSEGRVEIFYDGAWGTVCDDHWGLPEATIVCRMLGYEGADAAEREATFGQGTGTILLDDVMCNGDEDDLLSCDHRPIGTSDCRHYEDAGVRCTAGDVTPTLPIRLVGGSNPAEGRVEVLYKGVWGTVCDDEWDLHDAAVVCRMLGYPGAYAAERRATFGEGTDMIFMDDVQCTGDEHLLTDCPHVDFRSQNCRHYEDAGVRCTQAA